MTSVSLLAIAIVFPIRIAASVDSNPTFPKTALTKTVVSGCVATSTNPLFPYVKEICGNSFATPMSDSSVCTETNSGCSFLIISRDFSIFFLMKNRRAGSPRQRAALARGDRRHLPSRRLLTQRTNTEPAELAEQSRLCGFREFCVDRHGCVTFCSDADSDLALWCASPSDHRRARRGLQGPRRVHPGSADRGVRSGVRGPRTGSGRRTPSPRRTDGSPSTTC